MGQRECCRHARKHAPLVRGLSRVRACARTASVRVRLRMTTACEREEAAFISVADVARFLLPCSMSAVSCAGSSSVTSTRLSTTMPSLGSRRIFTSFLWSRPAAPAASRLDPESRSCSTSR